MITKNKKSQLDTWAFIGMVVSLIIVAPFLIKITSTTTNQFAVGLNQTNNTNASNLVNSIGSTFGNWVDTIIIVFFISNLIVLLIFAYLVDTNPIFLVLYIISAVFTMMFAPYVIEPAKEIFGLSTLSTEVAKLPMTSYILTRFSIIILVVIVISGIIMYAKISRGGGRGGSYDPYA